MEQTVNERIKILINTYANGENKVFSKETGIPESTLSSILGSRKTEPGFKVLFKIANRYDKVNLNWLIKGIGDIEGNGALQLPNTDSGNFKTQLKNAVKEAIGELIHNSTNAVQEGKKILNKENPGTSDAK